MGPTLNQWFPNCVSPRKFTVSRKPLKISFPDWLMCRDSKSLGITDSKLSMYNWWHVIIRASPRNFSLIGCLRIEDVIFVAGSWDKKSPILPRWFETRWSPLLRHKILRSSHTPPKINTMSQTNHSQAHKF